MWSIQQGDKVETVLSPTMLKRLDFFALLSRNIAIGKGEPKDCSFGGISVIVLRDEILSVSTCGETSLRRSLLIYIYLLHFIVVRHRSGSSSSVVVTVSISRQLKHVSARYKENKKNVYYRKISIASVIPVVRPRSVPVVVTLPNCCSLYALRSVYNIYFNRLVKIVKNK